MGFSVLIIIIGIAAVVASAVQKQFARFRLPGMAAIVIGAVLWIAAAALISVPVGTVAVIVNRFTGLKPDGLLPGTHIIVPGVEAPYFYNARLQELTLSRRGEGGADLDESIKALSKEGLEISVDVTVQYQIIASKAPIIHEQIGPDFERVIIRPQVRSEVRNGIGQFNAAELISTKRKELETLIVKNLEAAFQKANIDLKAILLREVRIPDSVAKPSRRSKPLSNACRPSATTATPSAFALIRPWSKPRANRKPRLPVPTAKPARSVCAVRP